MVETPRIKESEKVEGCLVSYVMGVKRTEAKMEELIAREGSIMSSVTTEGLSSLTTSATNSIMGGSAMSGASDEIESRFKMEQERTTGLLRRMAETEKKGTEGLREEMKGEMKMMSDKMDEQNERQEKLRKEDSAKQNSTLGELRNMMMQMMQTKVATQEGK